MGGKTLPNSASKELIERKHRARMIERRLGYDQNCHRAHYAKQLAGGAKIYANLSAYHPDFGATAAKHAELKAQRAAGKLRFVPKAGLRAQRSGLLGRMGLR